MVESTFNLSADQMQRLSKPLWLTQEALFTGDFVLWTKANWALYLELSPFMTDKEQATVLNRIEKDKQFKSRSFVDNIKEFGLTGQYLRRIAHKNKLLLREEEDTTKHGG